MSAIFAPTGGGIPTSIVATTPNTTLVSSSAGAVLSTSNDGDADNGYTNINTNGSGVRVLSGGVATGLIFGNSGGITATEFTGPGDGLTGLLSQNIVGRVNSPTAGQIGELLTASLASSSATSLVTATAKTVVTLTLTPGVWDIQGILGLHPGAATTSSYQIAGVGITTNTLGADGTFSADPFAIAAGLGIDPALLTPMIRILVVSGTQDIYLVAKAAFAISTMTAYGTLNAVRSA